MCADFQTYNNAADLSDPRNAPDDDGFRRCEECRENFFFLPGHKELESCLDHCETVEDLRSYILELQDERDNLKRAQAKMINPNSLRRLKECPETKPLPVNWTILRNRLITLELALDNAEKLNGELQSRLRYKEGLIEELIEGLSDYPKWRRENRHG